MTFAKEKEFIIVHHSDSGRDHLHYTEENTNKYDNLLLLLLLYHVCKSPRFPQKGLSRPEYSVLRVMTFAKEKEFILLQPKWARAFISYQSEQ